MYNRSIEKLDSRLVGKLLFDLNNCLVYICVMILVLNGMMRCMLECLMRYMDCDIMNRYDRLCSDT